MQLPVLHPECVARAWAQLALSQVRACVLSHFSCVPLFATPHGQSSVHGILQARMLEQVAIPPPGDLPDPVR